MSVIDKNKIDWIDKNETGEELVLAITDHLEWNNEYEHLIILQNKMNLYFGYIENKEYNDIYPNNEFESYNIQIYFKYKITDKCKQFLEVAQKQVEEFKIRIVIFDNIGDS